MPDCKQINTVTLSYDTALRQMRWFDLRGTQSNETAILRGHEKSMIKAMSYVSKMKGLQLELYDNVSGYSPS